MSFKEKLVKILSSNSEYLDSEGHLLKQKIIDDAEREDRKLIELLVSDTETKKEFFVPVQDVCVFESHHFVAYVKDKNFLNESYTDFSNKIGLSVNNKLISSYGDVSLVFPYKDCILEGGQTKEEQARKEIFFNKILAKDEINRLLAPKALVNFEKWDKRGCESKTCAKVDSVSDTDNLLVKGNNLLALHCIKERFLGRVKLIYIDPPYNTDSDSFKYNDSFTHSTWLTFMKNRLEIAKQFLTEDGVICVHCDDTEQAYLKVLMDEIFDRNFVSLITCKVKSAGGLTSGTEPFFNCCEYIMVYSKNKNFSFNTVKVPVEIVSKDSKTVKNYNSVLYDVDLSKKEFIATKDDITWYRIPKGNFQTESIAPKIKNMSKKDFYDQRNKLYRLTALSGGIGEKIRRHIADFNNNEDLFVYEYVPTKGKDKDNKMTYFLYKSQTITMLKDLISVDDEKQEIIKLEHASNLLSNDWWQGIANEGGVTLKNGKKPEKLIQLLLKIFSTDKTDVIMDFFVGCGTTAAVAHKMGRQWVAIEQIDDQIASAKTRLQNVICGDKTGISKDKDVDWNGGGSFVYCELATYNQKFIDDIYKANDTDALMRIWDDMKEKGFLLYNIDIKKFDENISDFQQLSVQEQKDILINILNMNMLYVPLADIEDKSYNISQENIELNKAFYGSEYVQTEI